MLSYPLDPWENSLTPLTPPPSFFKEGILGLVGNHILEQLIV